MTIPQQFKRTYIPTASTHTWLRRGIAPRNKMGRACSVFCWNLAGAVHLMLLLLIVAWMLPGAMLPPHARGGTSGHDECLHSCESEARAFYRAVDLVPATAPALHEPHKQTHNDLLDRRLNSERLGGNHSSDPALPQHKSADAPSGYHGVNASPLRTLLCMYRL